MIKLGLLFISIVMTNQLAAQEVIPLYKGPIPNSRETPNEESFEISTDSHVLIVSKVTRPSLTVFLPPMARPSSAAVIICPGGGYSVLAAGHEGYDVAKKLNKAGIAAFVLKYRIPSDSSMLQKEIGPLQDAQRAIQLVRENARRWHLNPGRIGIMGFSAGGHLASTAGTHFGKAYIDNPSGTSLRPDFMILVYPVISFSDSIGHSGSRDNLLGKNPDLEKIRSYSNELQINEKTPPAFLVHARNDDVVKVQNSIDFYEALRKNNVPAEIYLYQEGGHGFGMNNPRSPVKWLDLAIEWMRKNGWLEGV
jgi:acetyl esterase/lipase